MNTHSTINWWNSSARNHVYARWIVLVLINALFPFLLSLSLIKSPAQFVGIMFAVLSFIVLYAEFDHWLLAKQYRSLSKQLRVSAAVKVATVLLPFIDMICGMISIELTKLITGLNLKTSSYRGGYSDNLSGPLEACVTYITTMIDGFLLSAVVAAIIVVSRLAIKIIKYKKQNIENL